MSNRFVLSIFGCVLGLLTGCQIGQGSRTLDSVPKIVLPSESEYAASGSLSWESSSKPLLLPSTNNPLATVPFKGSLTLGVSTERLRSSKPGWVHLLTRSFAASDDNTTLIVDLLIFVDVARNAVRIRQLYQNGADVGTFDQDVQLGSATEMTTRPETRIPKQRVQFAVSTSKSSPGKGNDSLILITLSKVRPYSIR